MMEDPRKTGLKDGLRQLTLKQLYRVINYPKEMVLDTYNYEDGKFCALAVAVELDKTMLEPTHDKVFQELTNMGYKVYNTRGIEGNFYTTNRKEDLLQAAREVMKEKISELLSQGKCPCLEIRNCGTCKDGNHIFCNFIPHGDPEEAYNYFVNNPDVTKQITPRTPSPEYDRAIEEIKKRENAE